MKKTWYFESLLLNGTLKAGKIEYTYKTPFDLIAEGVQFEKKSAWVDKFRTMLVDHAEAVRLLLQQAA